MYALAEFQPFMPITFGVIAETEKLICTASIGKIKYRRLLTKLTQQHTELKLVPSCLLLSREIDFTFFIVNIQKQIQ